MGTLVPLAVLLLLIDSLSPWLKPLRAATGLIVLPVHVLADAPARLTGYLGDGLTSHSTLMAERSVLRAEVDRHVERLARADPDGIVVAWDSRQSSSSTLTKLGAADGALQWSHPLEAPPLAVAVLNDRSSR